MSECQCGQCGFSDGAGLARGALRRIVLLHLKDGHYVLENRLAFWPWTNSAVVAKATPRQFDIMDHDLVLTRRA